MAARDSWDPKRYESFKQERTQPFHDLLALVQISPGGRVLDLGSGTGELTRILHEKVQACETVGLERSGEMLSRSDAFQTSGLRFLRGEIENASALGSFDLVFSNAALHWVENHRELLKNLGSMLRPGGQLAVQVPANHEHASHLRAAEVAQSEPFREQLRGYVRHTPVLAPEAYAQTLTDLGFVEVDAHQRVYQHELPSRASVVEWVRGTTLTVYEERLTPAQYDRFLEVYRERLLPCLESTKPYPFQFTRTFFRGVLPA